MKVLLNKTTGGWRGWTALRNSDGLLEKPSMHYLRQGLKDQGSLGCLSVLLVGLSFQSHLHSLRLAHRLDGASLRLPDPPDLLGLSLGYQHCLHPDARGTHMVVQVEELMSTHFTVNNNMLLSSK